MEKNVHPYGFLAWLNKVWQIGLEKEMWEYSIMEYQDKLDVEAWKEYFMIGLSPSKAIDEDINEQF